MGSSSIKKHERMFWIFETSRLWNVETSNLWKMKLRKFAKLEFEKFENKRNATMELWNVETRVPKVPACLPRGGGARVGVGMLRGGKDSLNWEKIFQMFEFLELDIKSFNCLNSFNWNYQIAMSCFLEDVAPIFKSFQNFLNGSLRLFDTHPFRHVRNLRFLKLWDSPK